MMGSATSQLCAAYVLCILTSITLTACGGTRTSNEPSAATTQPPIAAPAPTPPPSPAPPLPVQPLPPGQPIGGCAVAPPEQTLRSLAANRSYTLEPAPNYTATTDPLDTQQLTDGRISEGTLWHDTAAVGWSSVRPVTITIDLGEVHAISEVRWHSAAGSAEVKWPAAIDVFVSSDGRMFHWLGDLIAADAQLAALPTDAYRAHTLRLAVAAADARYVRLMADRDGSYVFADEIEVLGPADGANRTADSCSPVSSKSAAPVEDTLSAFWTTRVLRRARLAIDRDAMAIAEHLAALNLSSGERQRLTEQLAVAAAAARAGLDGGPLASSRLPLNASHAGMYAVAADAEHTAGEPSLSIWSVNPWDPLDPLARPAGGEQPGLSTALMRGERRAVAFNVRASSAAPLLITLRVALPGFAPGDLRLYRVNWTGNDASRWAAAELELLGDGGGDREVTLVPGVTQQIWVQVQPTSTPPGTAHGAISVMAGATTQQLPLDLQVYETRMPDALATHFGGWDYSDGSLGHAVTTANRAQLVDYLRSSHVDTPWATRRVLHWNHVSRIGTISGTPDATALTQWLREWPNASRFRVFLSVRHAIGTVAVTDPRFDAAVAAWAQSWATQIRTLHKSPEQFDLLLVDEPQSDAQAATTVAWARAIRNSGTGFRIWTDPMWRDPSAMPADLLDAVDTIAINSPVARQGGSGYWNWAQGLQAEGKSIEVYAASGPARLLDPYAYYRLAAWRAYSIGAGGVTLWSFSDTRGPGSDNEFAARDYDYSPLFIRADGVRPGKQMEAAVEGLQDIEYLHVLSQALAGSTDDSLRAQAQALLDSAKQLAVAARDDDPAWSVARDRTAAERMRLSVGALLERME